jgi:NTP pyrophosphatase (non-canonical NTP hydrolase)
MRNNKFKVEFEENREVKINFDLYEFLNNQEQIFLKHQPPTCNNTSLEKFDKIFINLIEEMYEVKEEILKSNKNMNTKESIREELVDVINYVGTSITVFFEEYKSELRYLTK